MSSTTPIRHNQFTVYPYLDQKWQLTQVAIEGDKLEGVSFYTRYQGDAAVHYTDRLENNYLIVTAEIDNGVLKTIAIYSKHKAPYDFTVKTRKYPTVNDEVNRKYLDTMFSGQEDVVDRLYTLLEKNPQEHPMIHQNFVRRTFTVLSTYPNKDGLVDLRHEVTQRKFHNYNPCCNF